jgi:hypothetical protein
MKKTLPLVLLISVLTVTACTPVEPAAPALPDPTVTVEIQIPSTDEPTEAAPATTGKEYSNSYFGLGFQFPANWYGPDEYISDPTLRVAVGSDVVYPYGEPPAEPSAVTNSYSVVLQYTKNNQNEYANETYEALSKLSDGESVSGSRGMMIRVRQLSLGGFTGFEYISTLSESAQTEAMYAREVILIDDQANVITVLGTPNNVEVGEGANWRDVYKTIDEANQEVFHEIVDSIAVE